MRRNPFQLLLFGPREEIKERERESPNDGEGGGKFPPTAFRVSKSGLRCCGGRMGSARDFQAAFKPLLLPLLLLLPSLVL